VEFLRAGLAGGSRHLGALTDLVRVGKVRYIGHSTFPASTMVEAQSRRSRRRRTTVMLGRYGLPHARLGPCAKWGSASGGSRS
jgi:aryl-alcohol dehydrogenase-like predicted oxidoreductase